LKVKHKVIGKEFL